MAAALISLLLLSAVALGGSSFAAVLAGAGTGDPWIASDKPDYAPGERVTLNGGGWQPGESVNIDVNDDQGNSWRRNVDVTADAAGTIIDQFDLPDWFVAVYTVRATGELSGVATTTFTDAITAFSVRFPADNTMYSPTSYNAGCIGGGCGGCAGQTAAICGGVNFDKDSTVPSRVVDVSIKRNSDGLYWNGSGFASAAETFNSASPATDFTGNGNVTWLYPFSAPADGSYTVRARAEDSKTSPTFTNANIFTITRAEVSINNVSQAEGNAGTSALAFTVTRSGSTTGTSTVSYATANGTATTGDGDYVGTTGTLTFDPGETAKTINVTLNGDTKYENDETFVVNLSSPGNATITDNQGAATIVNDDAPPTLTINDPSVTEGNSGTKTLTFTVTRSGPTAVNSTVDFATDNGTATGGASCGSGIDYVARTGTLTISSSSATFTVTLCGDNVAEADETFSVSLSNANHATIVDGASVGTILNDDGQALTINDVSLAEGNSGTKAFAFTVTKAPASGTASVAFTTANGTAPSAATGGASCATAGVDYLNTSGTLNFNNEATKTVTVIVCGDMTFEPDEMFFVNLSGVTGTNAAIVDNQGIGTISNDDPANSPPSATVALNTATPTTNQTLTATTTKADTDGDPVTLTYVWKVNGVAKKTTPASSSLTDTFDLSVSGNGDKGETVTVDVTPNDGHVDGTTVTDSAVVINTAPSATVALNTAAPKTNETLTATATRADDDGDLVKLTYVWKVGGATKKTTSASSSLTDTFDLSALGNGDKGQAITVEVTPNDGDANGAMVSASATVVNSPPSATNVLLSATGPKTKDTISVSFDYADDDGDAQAGTTYQWQKKSPGATSFTDIAGANGSSLNLATAGNGDKGDQLRVIITPKDGSAFGTGVFSNVATVVNSAPVISAVSLPAGPKTKDVISASVSASDDDGDTLAKSYKWYKNGTLLGAETGSSLDLGVAGNGDKGDKIRVAVTASDGDGGSDQKSSDEVTIVNSAPVISAVTLPAGPKTKDVISASVSASDDDGDTLAKSYTWYKNGTLLGAETGSSLDLAVAGNGDKGDTIKVEVTASDGDGGSDSETSNEVTIVNSPPVVTAVTLPAGPKTKDVVSATVSVSDDDNDAVAKSYKWYKNGTLLPAETSSSLDLAVAGNGDKGDTIKVEVTASDGDGGSDSETSNEVTIVNSAPSATVALDTAAPKTNDVLTATATRSDDDEDAVSLRYIWKLNGSIKRDVTKASATDADLSDSFDLAPAGNGNRGDTINVEVTPSDGETAGATVEDSATVANSVPVATAQSVSTNEDTAATITLAGTDADNEALSFKITKLPSGGELYAGSTTTGAHITSVPYALSGDQVTYNPHANFNGLDSFEFKANDGTADSASATVSITVNAVNDPPVLTTAAPDANGTEGDTLATAGRFSDVDAGDSLTVTANNTKGTFTDNGDGTWSWSFATMDNVAVATITVTARDASGATASDSFDYSAVNAPPTATFVSPTSVNEGATFQLSLTNAQDRSSADTLAGFKYRFDCGTGTYTVWSSGNTVSCPTTDNGTRAVKGQIQDKDMGTTTYTGTVAVVNVNPSVTTTLPVNGSNFTRGQLVSISANFSDVVSDGPYACQIAVSDGRAPVTGTVSASGTTGKCTKTISFSVAGTFTITVKVRDKDGAFTRPDGYGSGTPVTVNIK